MNLLPTFGFKGTVLPVIDKTDKLYLLIENDCEHRVLLNVVSFEFNKFVNIDSKSSKLIRVGNFTSDFQLRVFYHGQELFDFDCNEISKSFLLFYSNYIFKKETESSEISFSVDFSNGLKLNTKSNKPQNLFIQIIDDDKNEILCEDNFISGESYLFNPNKFVKYKISVYNEIGDKLYNYSLDLKDKQIWIKLESSSVGETVSWIPYIDEFRKKHQCKVLCTTYWNNLFKTEYPNITFIEPTEFVKHSDVFSIYKIRSNIQDNNFEEVVCERLGLELKKFNLNPVLEHIKKNAITNPI